MCFIFVSGNSARIIDFDECFCQQILSIVDTFRKVEIENYEYYLKYSAKRKRIKMLDRFRMDHLQFI